MRRSTTPIQGASFLQVNGCAVNFLRGTNNSFYSEIAYRICNYLGHHQAHCPVATDTSRTCIRGCQRSNEEDESQTIECLTTKEKISLSHRINFNKTSENAYINPNWVLLNSESIDHIFCSNRLVMDIVLVTNGEFLRLYSSSKHLETHQKGKFGGFTVLYNPSSLVNILSLSLVTKQYHITIDSSIENVLVVHILSEHIIKFFLIP